MIIKSLHAKVNNSFNHYDISLIFYKFKSNKLPTSIHFIKFLRHRVRSYTTDTWHKWMLLIYIKLTLDPFGPKSPGVPTSPWKFIIIWRNCNFFNYLLTGFPCGPIGPSCPGYPGRPRGPDKPGRPVTPWK